MSIRFAFSNIAAGVIAVGLVAGSTSDATAQAYVLKECGGQYQTAKAANELRGQSWIDFLKVCRARLAEQSTAETLLPASEFAQAPAPLADVDLRDCIQERDHDLGISACSRFLAHGDKETQRDRAIAYYNRGVSYLLEGDYNRAIADYSEAIWLDPKDVDAYINRGDAHEKRGELHRALADFEAVLSIEADHGDARAGRERVRAALAAQSSPSVLAEVRVALVIGNVRYAAQSPLDNPKNDAAAIAEALRQAGFTKVVLVEDLSRKALVEALQEFQNDADRADWAVIYFSGHGVEIGGENYLVPVDAQLASDRNAPDEAVSLSRVMDSVHGAQKLRMVILDACRNNPFIAGMRRSLAFRSRGKGLAPPSPPPGTLVFYAAKEGEEAQDGQGENSPFAAALARNLSERGLELFKMLRYVTVDVQEATRDAQGRPTQHPTFYGDLASRDDFYFRP